MVHAAGYNRGMAATPATEVDAARAPAETAADRARRLYDADWYTWATEQARALRRRDFEAIDWDNLIEEVADLGKSQEHAWESLCARTIQHLQLIERWGWRSPDTLNHWMVEVRAFRLGMAKQIRRNPGLKGKYAEMFAEAWEDGRELTVGRLVKYELQRAGGRAGRKEFKAFERKWDGLLPADCPYRLEDVTAFDARRDRKPHADIWPPSVARALDAAPDREPDLVGLAQEARTSAGRAR